MCSGSKINLPKKDFDHMDYRNAYLHKFLEKTDKNVWCTGNVKCLIDVIFVFARIIILLSQLGNTGESL